MKETGVLPPSKLYFHTASPFAKNALYYLSNGGRYICSNKYIIERDNYFQFLFIYVKKGKMEISYNNQIHYAGPHSFVFLDCYNPHLYRSISDQVSFSWMHFTGNASREHYEALYNYNGCVFPLESNWRVPDYLEQILSMMENNEVDEQSASILIQRIFYELDFISNHSESDTIDEKITKSISFIENHYMDDISLEEIANHVNISPYHFSRVFKKYKNYSPHQYLISYRINKAKDLLHHTTISVNDIAFKCGFNSASHFVNTFKRHTNLSPNQFRKIKF
ncbi:AraC family transcriptional regulator [Oceanobacillus sp. Castelsardo]|uniref:AraC family transcriptional regulator n=1 Tax=Oceanobacillus sp. Castelsardo TaxID=1851204 RepID=UPI000837D92B|nr:AraC family transcriptional regulator [Oceanobacillus sp. Castelsardo]